MAGAYLNKEEVEDLVRSFQQSLASVTQDIERVTQQIAALDADVIQKTQEKVEAEHSREARHLELQEAEAVSDLLDDRLDLYEGLRSSPQEEVSSADLRGDIEAENQKQQALNEVNAVLRAQLKKYERRLLEPRECRNCKKQFIPSKRSSECKYHPGQLKFYSCRQCGQEAYYTCCNACKDCVAGCRTTSHVSH